ncbi:hypothetical protein niasHT_016612 [Heterodera trifolii]|uniref:Uncharacterized protein n=1 Tax=Heterodera trifolii TaxID=157864 RepID=A0ABD2LJS9_9BILA
MNILFLFAICFVFLTPLGEGTKNLENIPSGSTINEAAEDAQQSDQKFLMGQIDEAKKNEFGNREAVILFLYAHRFDPRLIEFRQIESELERISNGQTKCVFLLLRQAGKRLTRHPENFSLILDEQILVAVVHHCYTADKAPRHQLKFIFETVRPSTAIQNSYHLTLAHTKRMQQLFTLPGVVERFFPRPEEAHMVKAIREVLTKSLSIGEGDEEAEEIIKDGTVLQQFSGEAHQMKTKSATENEGGIWKGKSVYDSPLLV